MKTLIDIFDVRHGNKMDLNKMTLLPGNAGGINFVGRSSRKLGITATVAPIPGVEPYPEGLITVALGGTRLLASFVQERPFYTAQNVDVLKPKKKMTFAQKVYACLCIRRNRFRYGAFGREANRTLHSLLIPEARDFPRWIGAASRVAEKDTASPAAPGHVLPLDLASWKPFKLSSLFEIKRGKGVAKHVRESGETPYIGALDRNNGLVGYVSQPAAHPAGTLTLNWNGIGGVGVAFYQPQAYWCSGDVVALYPQFKMTAEIALFMVPMIRKERYRFSFGRKLTSQRMADLELRLPADGAGAPDYDFMQAYVKTLPFSSQI